MKDNLNLFEIKAELNSLQEKLNGVQNFQEHEILFKLLDSQSTKTIIVKLLLKELVNVKLNAPLIKFLLLRYGEKEDLNSKLWEIIKNPMVPNLSKIVALDILRDITTDWNYDECENFLDAPQELIDADTKRLLTSAVINPEVQIDFLDFLSSLNREDKMSLINSLADDYSGDELANILIPVFVFEQRGEIADKALELLGESKSELALNFLNSNDIIIPKHPKLNKAVSTLKIAGIREVNQKDFYKQLLSNSVPYKFYTVYPDGEGNQSIIFTRIKPEGRVQFVAVVINDYYGIRECFGFNDISKFECDTIISQFYKNDSGIKTNPKVIKEILYNAEETSIRRHYKIPYEYICWRNLLFDIEFTPEPVKDILDKGFEIQPLREDGFLQILDEKFVELWFMTEFYNSQFESFISALDDNVKKSVDYDFDNYINENMYEVFNEDEVNMWKDRILNCSFLSLALNNDDLAYSLYKLYYDEKYLNKFYVYILQRSIYEYFVWKREIAENLSENDYLYDVVKKIEEKWVR